MKNTIIIFITIILSATLVTSCKNKYSKEIEKSCSDCSETKIRKSDFILVTNKNGESNVFSKNQMRFVLSKWYPAKYDEGAFFDDITFTVNGSGVMCSESDYTKLSDDFLMNKSSSSSYSGSSSSSSGSSSSYGSKTCSWCGKSFSGTHYTHLGKMAPCQSSTNNNSIGKWCSMKCCSEARRSSCPSCR